ncbi:MAG: tetratricopeptide repeat protein [Polyangia bacterium]
MGLSKLSIRTCLCGLSLMLAVAAPEARAETGDAAAPAGQPSTEEMSAAKLHFDRGARFFQEANYAAARTEFQTAYDLSKLTPLLFNLARTAEMQGKRDEAIEYYEKYLATNPSDAEDVRPKLAKLKEEQAAAPAQAASGGAVPLDGGPGWLKGYAKLPPIPALATLGAGVAFLAIGIGTGVSALSVQQEVASSSNRYWTGDVAALYDKGKTLNNTAIAFDVLGGIAIAGGAAWTGYWLYLRGKQPAAAAPVAPASATPTARILPTGNGLAVVGTF